tara:strand:- start:2828 stop:3952 length:1125 start_codon:yes stop_codon:yes gene_type:complete
LIINQSHKKDEVVLAQFIENVPYAIFRLASTGNLLIANSAMVIMLGYDNVGDFKAQNPDLEHQFFENCDQWQDIVKRLESEDQISGFHVEWRRKDKKKIWVSLNLKGVRVSGGELVIEGAAVELTNQYHEIKALADAKEAAEVSSRAKNKFLAYMSHELRTPLNCIVGFSAILMKEMFGPLGAESYKRYSYDIHSAGSHMVALISDIMDISKIEAGEYSLSLSKVDVGALVLSSVEMIRDTADRNRVIILCEFDEYLPELEADKLRLKQILLNLLSNAVKFSSPGGQVFARAGFEISGGVTIEVEDNGVGIDPKELQRVQLPFEQARQCPSSTGEGAGLGLYFSKQFAALHGAEFSIESELGIGTRVRIYFPAN